MNPFPPDALDANRRGDLSDEQLRGFGALSRYRRRDSLSIAAFLVAGALLIGFFASPTSSAVLRALVTVGCLAIAAVLVVRSVTGSDALTRDLRRVQVQSVEGAIGKRRPASGGRSVSTYFLDVGDRSFKVAPATYDAAPDAGIVRVYFLPRSRKIVNLERLPDPPLQSDLTPRGIVESLGTALWSHSRREANEARAGLAGVADALKATFAQSPGSPPEVRDPRPLSDAIIGTWSNALMKVSFSADGRVAIRMFGTERDGHWSVDGTGRLRADITGRQETADAWVAGNQLTVTAEGKSLTLTRESSA
jgi:hypothetical protein